MSNPIVPKNPSVSNRNYYTLAEAANILGIGYSVLYKASRLGNFGAYRIMRKIMIPKQAVHNFCQDHKIPVKEL